MQDFSYKCVRALHLLGKLFNALFRGETASRGRENFIQNKGEVEYVNKVCAHKIV